MTGNPQDNDLCIIRLSEIYLNAAEAAFKLGKRSEALGYLNQIVSRANPNKSVSDSELSLKNAAKNWLAKDMRSLITCVTIFR